MIINHNLWESMITYLDNEREGAEIGLSMPMQLNKIPDLKTVTGIQFHYRCHHLETMTSKKFRQDRAPTHRHAFCGLYTFGLSTRFFKLVYVRAFDTLFGAWSVRIKKKQLLKYSCVTDTIILKPWTLRNSDKVVHPHAHQNGHKKCVRIRRLELNYLSQQQGPPNRG